VSPASFNTITNRPELKLLLWPPYRIGQAIIFLPCGFFFYLSFSSPNLSRHRLDVCHTSTHGVAVVRIYAGLKRPARGSLKIQDAKKSPKIRHLGTIAQLCRLISSQLSQVSTVGKKLLNSNTFPTCPYNMVNFGPLAAEICSLVSTCFASWQRYCMALYSSRRQPNFAALNRGRHPYSAGRPSRWALAHILVYIRLVS